MTASALAVAAAIVAATAMAEPTLNITTYFPQHQSVFGTNSVLLSGPTEIVLFDGQFSTKDGSELVQLIRDTNKNLTHIVITAGDPDFYFGLQPMVEAFPNVPIVSTRLVSQHINSTYEAKLKTWGQQLGQDAIPDKVYVPTGIDVNASGGAPITVDGAGIEFKAPDNYAAYIYVPAEEAVLGGNTVSTGIYIWECDTPTKQSRMEWVHLVEDIVTNVSPRLVVPSHAAAPLPNITDMFPLFFTRLYLLTFEEALELNNSTFIIEIMKDYFPNLGAESNLNMSAEVLTGEVPWP